MDKRAVEEFIEAFAWFASNADKIKTHLDRQDPAIVAVANWFERATNNPRSFRMTNGFTVSVMVIKRIYAWDPIDSVKAAEIRTVIEELFPEIYGKPVTSIMPAEWASALGEVLPLPDGYVGGVGYAKNP